MFKNYITIAFRNLFRHKEYTLINTFGLAIGLASAFLILLYIQHELSYDHNFKNYKRIYRTVATIHLHGRDEKFAATPASWGPAMTNEITGVDKFTRYYPTGRKLTVSFGEKKFYEEGIVNVDSTFFDVFHYKFLVGNSETALDEPYTIVITKNIAKKYFGDENPVGKVLKIDNQRNFRVTAVMQNVPSNSHMQFDMLVSFSSLRDIMGMNFFTNWLSFNCFTYVLISPGTPEKQIEAKFPAFIKKYYSDAAQRYGITVKAGLQPVTDIHLYSHREYEFSKNSDITFIYILSAIAVFLLVIGSINFMNLATARYANRAKEVGIRKVLGAFRKQLIQQFIGESVFITFCSFFIALIIIETVLPYYDNFIGRKIEINFFNNLMVFGGLVILTLIVGVISGSYPAFFLSKFNPANVLKGTLNIGSKSSGMRKTLVIVQFTLSIFLLAGTFLVNKQLHFMETKNLGFNKNKLLVLQVHESTEAKKKSFETELLKDPDIAAITNTSSIPGRILDKNAIRPEGYADNQFTAEFDYRVGFNFINVLGIKMAEGRNFNEGIASDSNTVVINQAAVESFGWKNPVGKYIFYPGRNLKLKVIGVMKDFNYMSLREKIQPLILYPGKNFMNYMVIKYKGDNVKSVINYVKSKWSSFDPSRPIDYFFLDKDFDKLFSEENRLSNILLLFSSLAILIACLGLYGLSSFMTQQRTKEIGIRKVLGASLTNILFTLSKEYAFLVGISTVIAWTLVWYTMNKWLSNFAYHINVDIYNLLYSAFIALFVALVTVSYQTLKTAIVNPVNSLKYE